MKSQKARSCFRATMGLSRFENFSLNRCNKMELLRKFPLISAGDRGNFAALGQGCQVATALAL
jgi:hypothetical protein